MMHDASSGLGLTAGIAMGQAGVCVNVQRGNAHVREGPAVESSEDGSPDGPITRTALAAAVGQKKKVNLLPPHPTTYQPMKKK